MRDELADGSRQSLGMATLAKLLASPGPPGSRELESAAVEAIILGLTAHPTDPDVQQTGCEAIASIAEVPRRQHWLTLSGACEAVVGALTRSALGAPDIAAAACEALGHLTAVAEAARKAVHAGARAAHTSFTSEFN